MKPHKLSHNSFVASPILVSTLTTAHSGPELASSIPQYELAHELAMALFSDHVQLVQHQSAPFGAGVQIGISLSRK